MNKKYALLFIITLIAYSGNAQVSFEEHLIGESAKRVTGISSADFDLDGDIDIITCLRIDNKILGYTNISGEFPSFDTNIIAENIQGPFYIFASLLDQDDYQDIVVSLVGSNQIIALLNPGNLNQAWQTYIVTENFIEPHGLAISDINGDGLNDIVGTASASSTIAFWLNNGNTPDTWEKTVLTDNFLYTQSIDVIDFDFDGDIDIIASAQQANTIALWLNDGELNPSWDKVIVDDSFSAAHDAYAADANDDKLMDIFGAGFGNNQIACWLNNGGNPISFNKIIIDDNFSGALTVRTGDIDNDGDQDAVGTAWGNGTVAWFENKMNNSGGWDKHIITEDLHGAWPISLADFEGDNDIDILTGADKLNKPGTNGTFTLWNNLLNATGIEIDHKEIITIDITYYPPGNELWITPRLSEHGMHTIQVFDSLGRQLLSYDIRITQGNKSVLQLPTLGHTSLIHIVVLKSKVVTGRKTMVIN